MQNRLGLAVITFWPGLHGPKTFWTVGSGKSAHGGDGPREPTPMTLPDEQNIAEHFTILAIPIPAPHWLRALNGISNLIETWQLTFQTSLSTKAPALCR